MMFNTPFQAGLVMRIIHEATELSRPYIGSPMSAITPLGRVADLSPEAVDARSRKAAALLARMEAIDLDATPKDIGLTLRLIQYDLRRRAKEAEWYWLVVDGLGIGFYGMFAWTAYSGGFLLNGVMNYARGFRFEVASDADRYLAFVADVAKLIDQLDVRTKGQAERGIYMPKAQLEQALPLLERLKPMLLDSLSVAPGRLKDVDVSYFSAELGRRLETVLVPALDRACATLGDHQRHAPDQVGLSQYPGGKALYEELVRLHTTLDLTPEQVHQMGLEGMRHIRAAMAGVREEAGFHGDDRDYLNSLDNDPAWRADSIEGVTAVFQRYIERLKPKYADYFDFECPMPYGVASLPEALQGGMTFGFYDMPRADKPRGDYFFNGANLTKTQLSNVAAFAYHELVPGHHLHISTQQANTAVHPLHNDAFFNAFNEGWAEYAATLAGEAGMYAEPAERFGRLVNEAFLTCRLVVDTGMNALGWSLEQAREYMRENGFLPEPEVKSESIRYSCDIPGQALAYKIADGEIMRLREKMRTRLGARFDIRDFHRAVLHPGGMPIPLLEWHIDQTMEAADGD